MTMPSADDKVVSVRRQWNSLQIARFRLALLANVHWDTVSGGVKAPTPQPFLHAYVPCDGALDGDLDHSCTHGPPPHEIKICIVKKDNDADVFRELLRKAGPKPAKQI